MGSGFMKLYDFSQHSSIYTKLDKTQVPENFTTTGSTLFIEWYSGSELSLFEIFGTIIASNDTYYDAISLGEDKYCSAQTPCNHNEGDCDFNTDCNGTNIRCVSNSCPGYLGFQSGTDCCQDACFGMIDMESGIMMSPFYPDEYQSNLDCSSQITVDEGKFITIQFENYSVSTIA